MTREKALEAMDKLVAMGYHVTLHEADMQDLVHFADGEMTSIRRHLAVEMISLDKVDLRALVAAADELELDVGFSPITGQGVISFFDQSSPVEQNRAQVVSGRRRHPR